MEITIPLEESKFNGITLKENIGTTRIDELLGFELQDESEYIQLKRYKQLISTNQPIKYQHSRNNNIGRVFSKCGLSL